MTTSNSNIDTFAKLGLALACAGVWFLSEYVNGNLAVLPVKAVPTKQEGEAAKVFDVKTLFPVWVASASKTHQANESGDVESLFKERKIETAVAVDIPAVPAEPDYAALLGTSMRVDGIGEGGAFIAGKFYRVGESIADYEYPAKGRQVVPRLAEVRAKSIVVTHGKNRTEIKL